MTNIDLSKSIFFQLYIPATIAPAVRSPEIVPTVFFTIFRIWVEEITRQINVRTMGHQTSTAIAPATMTTPTTVHMTWKEGNVLFD